MRNKNITQENRYKNKFTERVKGEDYLVKVSNMIDLLNCFVPTYDYLTVFIDQFDDFKQYSTKGLSLDIRKVLVDTERKVVLIDNLLKDAKKENKTIINLYKQMQISYTNLKTELLKKMMD